LKAAFIVLVAALLVVGGAASCRQIHSVITEPVVLVDETVSIESGKSATYWLAEGDYLITVHSNDAVEVRFIGPVVGVESDPTTYYYERLEAQDGGGLWIHNPSGVFSNPNAIVHVKIVED